MKFAIASALVAVLAMAGLLGRTPGSVEASNTVVSISGAVTLTGVPGFTPTLQMGAHASGPAGSLTGQGFDSPFRGNPTATTPPGYCRFPLTGSLVGSVVTLTGTVSFSNDPTNLGVPVTIIADASTGAITFDFGSFVLTGTGSVVIAHS